MEAGCDQALSRQSSRDTAPEFLLLWPWQLPTSPLPLKPCWLNIFLDSRGSQYPSTKFIVFLKRLQSLFPCLSTENIIHPELANWVAQCPSVSQQVETTCLLILKDLNQTLYFYFFFFFKELYRHTLYLIIYGLCLNFWFIPGVTDHLDTVKSFFLNRRYISMNFYGHCVLISQQNFLFPSKIVYQVISILYGLFFKD